VVPEAELEDTGAGVVPASAGWFVLNARDARWFHREGRGDSLPFTGSDEFEAESYFPMLGMSLQVLSPGEPNSMYHWETEQEDFLVLAGEALLVVEGQERPLRQWDFVHCPPETQHVFVGAGEGPCVLLAVGSRQFQASGPWGK
jgi:oxalate decarboxylase/phosphoglucose isomerase-like protein (cupin superfamily)